MSYIYNLGKTATARDFLATFHFSYYVITTVSISDVTVSPEIPSMCYAETRLGESIGPV